MSQKFLRGIGITLIALPEPFTTPLGAALLLASYIEFKKQKADSYECLGRLVQSYMSRYKPFGHGLLTQPVTQPRIIHHVINGSLPQSPTGSGTGLGINTQVYSRYNSPRTRERVIHHTLDRNLFLLDRETSDHGLLTQPVTQPRIIHHVINGSLPQPPTGSGTGLGINTQVYSRYNSPRTRERVIHHTLDRNLFLLDGEAS